MPTLFTCSQFALTSALQNTVSALLMCLHCRLKLEWVLSAEPCISKADTTMLQWETVSNMRQVGPQFHGQNKAKEIAEIALLYITALVSIASAHFHFFL